MYETSSPNEQRTVQIRSGDRSGARAPKEERYLHTGQPASFIGRSYERYLEQPVGSVLVTLWIAGLALLGSFTLVLFLLGTWVVRTLTGA